MLNYRTKKKRKELTTNLGKIVLLAGVTIYSCHYTLCQNKNMEETPISFEDIRITNKSYEEAVDTTQSHDPSSSNSVLPSNNFSDNTKACGSFTEPTHGVLTSAFGQRWGRSHHGIDIGAQHGTEIHAADGGKVITSDWVDGYGYYILIDHENGYQTAYAHCSELLVSETDRVSQGQKIAYMGSTGNSTGPHLHFEIRYNGEYKNPLEYVMY